MSDPLAGCDPVIHAFEAKPGRTVYLRALDGRGRAEYIRLAKSGSMQAFEIVALSVCQSAQDGSLVYVDDEQRKILAAKDGDVLQRLALQVIKISGLAPDAVEEAAKK